MRFEKDFGGGRAFMEFALDGDQFVLKKRGFVHRFKSNGVQPCQPQMATESPLIHDGSQNVLSTTQDARNSTLTGSTLAGPNGSGQFLCVTFSTGNVDRTVTVASTTVGAQGSTAAGCFYGVLQNKPRGGEAADIGIFGISKVVCGSTSIKSGQPLSMSSTNAGVVVPYAASLGPKIGFSLETPTAVGQVITAFIQGGGLTST